MELIGNADNVEVDRIVMTTDTTCTPTGTGDNCANPVETTPPTVSITAPANNSIVNGTTTIQANATDSVAVTKVEFFVDGTLKSTDTTSPYSYALDTTSLSNGNHTITAEAFNGANLNASASVTVTVSNAPTCTANSSTPPTTPTNLAEPSETYTQINLTWSASNPSPGCTIGGYYVYRDGTKIATVTNGTTYSDTGLSASSSYSYAIQAFDNGPNTSALSGSSSFSTTADNVAPTIPGSFAGSSPNAGEVDLSWTASTDLPNPGGVGVAGYYIYRNGSSTPTYTINNPSTTSYQDTNVSASTTYTYTIVAFDKVGNASAPSNVVSVKTQAPTCSGTPSVPGGLASTSSTDSSIGLSWSASTASAGCTLSGYHIYRGGSLIGSTSGTTYSDTGLTPSTQYGYTVAAYDTSAHTSAQSSSFSVSTAADSIPPSAPTTVTASAVSSGEVSLSWSAVSDSNFPVGSYKIYRNSTLLTTVNAPTTSYNDTTVSANTSYTYAVSAVDTYQLEGAKTTATPNPVKTPTSADTTPPSAPGSVSAPVVAAQSVSLTWNASTDNVGVSGYNIFINGVFDTSTTTNSVAVSCIEPGVSYTFSIVAYDAAGNKSTASTVTALPPSGTTGDINCDHIINSTDLFTLLRNWNVTPAIPSQGDINGDVKVNSTDLFDLLRDWGKTAP